MNKKIPKLSLNPLKHIPQFVLLIAIATLTVFPLLWLVSTAFKSPSENIFQATPQLLPAQPTFENFLKVWKNSRFDLYLWNSFFVSSITVILNLLFCSLAAFPLARLNFKGRDSIFWAIVGTTMIPFQITMIPLYILAVQLNLKNTYAGLIFPYVMAYFSCAKPSRAFPKKWKKRREWMVALVWGFGGM